MHTVLAQVINMGLAKAVTITDAWLVTGGVDAGVMRLLGGGLRKYGAHAPCVGILPWGRLDNAVRDKLKSAHTQKKIMPVAPADFAHQVALEPHHSHFVLVNDPAEPKEGEEAWGREIPLRLALEERLQRHWKVPRLLMAVQGRAAPSSRSCRRCRPTAWWSSCASGGRAEMVAKFTDTLRERTGRPAAEPGVPAAHRGARAPRAVVGRGADLQPRLLCAPVVIEVDCTASPPAPPRRRSSCGRTLRPDKVPDESPLAERLSYEGPIVFGRSTRSTRGRTGMRGAGCSASGGPTTRPTRS